MKKTVVLIVVIVALAIVYFAWYIHGNYDAQPKFYKNNALSHEYTVLENSTNWQSVPVNSYTPFTWKVSTKTIHQTITTDSQNNFACGTSKASVTKYSSHSYPNSVGGWGSISIVDCGEYYFVYDYGDAGPHLFGPFNK